MTRASEATSTVPRTRVALMTLLTLALVALAATFPTEASAAGPCKVTGIHHPCTTADVDPRYQLERSRSFGEGQLLTR